MDSQDSPRPRLGGSHHLPPYSILYDSPWGLHINDVFFPKLPSWELAIPKIGTPITLDAHNFLCKQNIEMRFEANL